VSSSSSTSLFPVHNYTRHTFQSGAGEGLLLFFNLFLDTAFVGVTVDISNRYAGQSQQKQAGTAKKWRPTTHMKYVFSLHL